MIRPFLGYDVIYEQRERVFHRDIQTRENNVYENTRGKRQCFRTLERLRYPDSGLRVRVSPFCLPIFADVSIFTRNF
jgi:hypothetical protein